MSFNEEIDKQLELLDANICCSYGTGEVFCVRESKPEGYAEVYLTVGSNPCFHVDKIEKKVFPVLACRRCADHLVFVFDPQTGEWTLHIFEMTRSISKATWEEKILPQFNGGLTNAYAIMGVLRCCMDFAEVQVHCCYQKNKSETSPVHLKPLLGEPAPRDWLNDPVTFASYPQKTAQNLPLKLDGDGKGQLQL